MRPLDRDDGRRARLVPQHAQLAEDLAHAELADDELHRRVGRDLQNAHPARQDDEKAVGRIALADQHVAGREGLLGRAVEQEFAVLRGQETE